MLRILVEEVNLSSVDLGRRCITPDEHFREIFGPAQAAFQQLMSSEKLKGTSQLVDIYRVLDLANQEFTRINPLPCQGGCSLCCYQVISLTHLEMALIVQYIKQIKLRDRRRRIINSIHTRVHQVQNQMIQAAAHSEYEMASKMGLIEEMFRSAMRGIPCMFLHNGKCDIYPVRPLDCRIAKTREACGQLRTEADNPIGIRIMADMIAVEMEKDLDGDRKLEQSLEAWFSDRFARSFNR